MISERYLTTLLYRDDIEIETHDTTVIARGIGIEMMMPIVLAERIDQESDEGRETEM